MNLNLRVLWLWAVRNNSSKTNSREVLPSRHAGGALADEQLLVQALLQMELRSAAVLPAMAS